MRGAVTGCVVLACLVALLAERTEGHITFFSPKEMMLMKVGSSRLIGQRAAEVVSDRSAYVLCLCAQKTFQFCPVTVLGGRQLYYVM